MDLNFKNTIVKRCAALLSAAAVAASGFQALTVPAFAATSTESVGDFTISSSKGSGYSYDSSSGVLTISSAGSYTITGSSNSDRIVIDSSGDVELTLRSSTIISSTESPISVDSGNLTLLLGGSVTLLSTADNYAAISKATSNTLKITSSNGDGATTGALKATGGTDAAAIGGDYAKAGNNITIAGGTITAKGSDSGAGIGGGKYAGGSNITITGGTVTASSSDMGAGIGGGQASDGTSTGSNITITGGTVTATSSSGAGIGGGYSSTGTTVGSNITISGGFVTASSTNGAGIGAGGNGGSEAEGKTGTASGITISGGTVTASSANADGIGVGTNGVNSTVSDIVIYNSSVKASSVPITPVNASEESVYLYEFTDTTEGEAIIVDGETVIESVVYHSSSDKSQYIYLPKDSATAVYGGSYYTLSYSEEDGTASFTKAEIDSMEIPNAATLSAFAKMVNNGSTSLNGTVTANIDFSNYADMIGSESTPYAGTFDGSGYTITVDYDISSGTGNSGLFSYIDGGTVQNLKVDGTMDFSGDSGYTNVGGVIGYMNNGTISNVVSGVDITNTTDCPLASAGGIVGRLYDSSKVDSCIYEGSLTAYSSYDCVGGIVGYTRQYCSITKCANLGTLYATTGTNSDGDSVTPYLGGIIGYINSSYFSGMENCYNYGSVSADDTTYCGAIVGWLRNSSDNLTNNYWLEGSAEKGYGANDNSYTEPDSKTAEEFENGEVTYCLNGSVDGGTNWYQNLDNGETADSYPVLSSDHGTVSAACYIYCPDYSVSFYSNITSGTTIMGSETNHTYENGVCKYCGYVEGTLKTDDDGRYLIPDAATLISFAAEVNSGSTGINGILTADIDFTAYSTMIGSSTYPYAGTFDGGGYTITVGYDISSGTENIGLFSYIDGGTVQNLNVEGTMEFSGGSDYTNVGGVIGYMNNGTISNVVSSVNITNTADYPLHSAGGIVGRLYDSSTVDKCIYKGELTALNSYDCVGGIVGYTRQYCTITNCANLGTLYATKNGSTASYLGGIIGYINSSYFSGMENCYNYGSVSADDTTYCGAIVGWLRNSKDVLTNNYWLETSATKGYGANDKNRTEPDSKTADEFSSGVIAFLLNESVDGGTVWYQNIDNGETADSYPVLDSDHGVVYAVGVVYCPGYTEKSGAAGVSNTEGRTVDADGCNTSEHSYVNYVCKYCGEKETSTPSKASDGYYEIYTVPELLWLADGANSNANIQWPDEDRKTYYSARLMADIDLSGLDWTPMGYTSAYSDRNYLRKYSFYGTFDGNGHVIKNMTVNLDTGYGGFFGSVHSSNIKNLGVVDAYISCTGYDVGGISSTLIDSTMTNCYFTGTVKSSGNNVGALTGYINYTGVTRGSISNCYASAAVSGGTNTNALFGSITDNAIAHGGMTPSNCYYDTSKTSLTDSYATGCSAEEFAGGKVAYLLNGSTSGGTPWYQNLDNGETEDGYPILDSTHGLVYAVNYIYCPDYTETVYSNTESETVIAGSEIEHTYENSVCKYCGSIEEGALTTDSEGRYIIPDAATLAAFAAAVNSGSTDMDGIVTADIDFTANSSMIGSSTYPYAGTFDGGGYTITVNYDMVTGADNVGLFSYIDGGTVQNLTVEGNIDFTNTTSTGTQSDGGYLNIGGIAGYITNGTISNVVSGVNITSPTYPLHSAGGIVGRLYESTTVDSCIYTGALNAAKSWDALGGIAGYTYRYCTIKNCANLGTLYATKGTNAPYLGGILGYVNNKNFYGIQNCYNYGSVSADTETYCGAIVGWLRAASTNITNNYWLDTSASSAFGTNDTSNTAASCTAEEFESGEAAYLLNGSTGGGTDWYQNIDNGETADIYPLPDSSHGKVYYVAEIVYCPDYSEDGYSNTEADKVVRGSETEHSYSDGVCEYCSAINSELLTEDSEGRYVIPDAPTLAAFAATVNAGSTSISGIVTADIDFSGYSVMIGSESTPYAGTFDGGGYTITVGYNITSGKYNIGLFGYSDGGTIQNLTVEGYIDFTNAPNPGTDSDGKAGYVQVGGIVGYMVNGAISNVVSGVDIISSKTYPLHLTGGIAGSLYESVTVDSCIYKGNLTAYNSYDALGGIAGYVRRYVRITNTANLGTLYATTGTNAPYLGGIIGYVSSVNFYGIQNCYNYGSVSADDLTYCGAIAGNINNCSLYLTNNYWLDTSATKAYGRNNSNNIAPEASTAAQFESGETAYLLNGSVSGGTTWYQAIGTDSYPLLDSSHGTVYTTTTVYCPDLKDISDYNNTADEITVVGSETDHSYDDNSICSYCHCVKSEEPSQAADGYYEIENASQLYWIAEQVNQYADQDKSSSDSQNAYFVRLVADIDLSGIDWTPIGYTEYKNGYNYYPAYSFIGIFDGNGHVIKNMTVDTGSYGYAGLFGSVVYSGSTIKNLGVVDATVYGGGNNIGGIVGRLGDSTSMTNCYFTGTVEGYKYVGGLIGWSSAAITNCWASAEVTGTVSPVCALIGTDSGSVTVTNCYYDTSKTTVTDSNAAGCTAAEFESGSITWLLNGSTEGTTWVQTIGTDTYPVFAASDSNCAKVVKLTSEGSTVYANVVTGGVELSVSSSELSGIIIDTAVYGGDGGEYLNSVGVVIDDTLYQLENFYYVDSNGDYSATATDRAFFPVTRDSSSSETVTSVRGEATTSSTATADDSLLYFVTEAETGLTIKEAPENNGSSNGESNEISGNGLTENNEAEGGLSE